MQTSTYQQAPAVNRVPPGAPISPSSTIEPVQSDSQALPLIEALCDLLESHGISYCHWKSNEAIRLSETAENDLDLLVSRRDANRFCELLHKLGFREARTIAAKELPGVSHYFASDPQSRRFIHVHAHFQLVIGHDTTKNYHMPIEAAYIGSSTRPGVFRLPASEFELLLLVIRIVLKRFDWDAAAFFEGRISRADRNELEYLLARTDRQRLESALREHLPYVPAPVFFECLAAIQQRSSVFRRWRASRRMRRALSAQARRRPATDLYLRISRRVLWGTKRYILRLRTKRRLTSGGRLIAFIGGDGSGKSTSVKAMADWLSQHFEVASFHLGKPIPSLLSLAVKGPLFITRSIGLTSRYKPTPNEILSGESSRPPSLSWIVWQTLTARDRYLTYRKARSRATNGAIVVIDRFPLKNIRTMDGVRAGRFHQQIRSKLKRLFLRLESAYYSKIGAPDELVVLRIDPEVAVQRRHDEDPQFVRFRNQEIWSRKDWGPQAIVIDAGKPLEQTLAEIRYEVWGRV